MEIRYAFVEMLFALAAGEVAIAFAHIVAIERSLWLKAPAIAHLLVCLLLIAASWLGWSSSQWRRDKKPRDKSLSNEFNSPFTRNFVELLMDVCLVIIYFVIVRRAEITESQPFDLTAPSAAPEASWICWVFAIYIAWDLLTDVLDEPLRGKSSATAGEWIVLALGSTIFSVICWLMIAAVLMRASHLSEDIPAWRFPAEHYPIWPTIALDFSLACVVMLFRAIKFTVETSIHRRIPAVRKFKAFKDERTPKHHEDKWAMALLVAYFVSLGSSWLGVG